MGRIRVVAVFVFAALAIGGCSMSMFSERDQAWRRDAEAICFAKSGFRPTPYAQRIDRIRGKGSCGIWQPLRVSAGLGGSISFSQAERLNCPMTSAIDGWFWHVVQPAAQRYFGTPVIHVKTMGSYNCRSRNSRPGAKISEHGFGNAIDFGGFKLADGREITVLRGWRGGLDEQLFLREIHKGACGIFTTVIGPDGDRHHQDHFHFDLARHNEGYTYRYCR